MATRHPGAAIDFAGPTTYRIVVQGALSAHWRDRLAGLTVATSRPRDQAPRTTLVGRIRDQAELNGVLETLFGLHMPILTVEKIDDTASPEAYS